MIDNGLIGVVVEQRALDGERVLRGFVRTPNEWNGGFAAIVDRFGIIQFEAKQLTEHVDRFFFWLTVLGIPVAVFDDIKQDQAIQIHKAAN